MDNELSWPQAPKVVSGDGGREGRRKEDYNGDRDGWQGTQRRRVSEMTYNQQSESEAIDRLEESRQQQQHYYD